MTADLLTRMAEFLRGLTTTGGYTPPVGTRALLEEFDAQGAGGGAGLEAASKAVAKLVSERIQQMDDWPGTYFVARAALKAANTHPPSLASDFTMEDAQAQPLALLVRSYIEARDALAAVQPRQRGFGFSKPDHAAIGVAHRHLRAVQEQLDAALNATLTKGRPAAEVGELQDAPSYILAMRVLQSDFYVTDPDARDAVDDIMALHHAAMKAQRIRPTPAATAAVVDEELDNDPRIGGPSRLDAAPRNAIAPDVQAWRYNFNGLKSYPFSGWNPGRPSETELSLAAIHGYTIEETTDANFQRRPTAPAGEGGE